MADSTFYKLCEGQKSVRIEHIPVCDYSLFRETVISQLQDTNISPVAYFHSNGRLVILLLDKPSGQFLISSSIAETSVMESIGLDCLYQFERDISERNGIVFEGHPYLKPLRRISKEKFVFSKNDNRTLHDVNVGPVHAGIIEPGRFRFTCNGEKIVSLEICLGYQNRGLEKLLVNSDSNLKRMALCEQIAGDSVIANTIAASSILENGNSYPLLDIERALALELERIANHFSDIAALCGDCAYQLGQISVEPLRTSVVNSLQMWCGSRSGRSLVRPFGSYYKLGLETIDTMLSTLLSVKNRFEDVISNLISSPSLLSRLEGKCVLSSQQIIKFGVRGIIAKASAVASDIRSTAYAKWYDGENFVPVKLQKGDLFSRLKIRLLEADQSLDLSISFLKQLKSQWFDTDKQPQYDVILDYNSLIISPVEGFRGTIFHVVTTDEIGAIMDYRIFDPSTLAWPVLSYVMRGGQISDFPICNKSFNLSYLANDL